MSGRGMAKTRGNRGGRGGARRSQRHLGKIVEEELLEETVQERVEEMMHKETVHDRVEEVVTQNMEQTTCEHEETAPDDEVEVSLSENESEDDSEDEELPDVHMMSATGGNSPAPSVTESIPAPGLDEAGPVDPLVIRLQDGW